jgi:hypothetical protein
MSTSPLLRWRADLLALLLLLALCWLCFWRLLTPDLANQQSFVDGDFTGQFVSFAHYQAARLARGEVPLWNPYNLGGHPFLADTQSAVFYPPRLLTIAALNLTGGSTPARMLDALQKEVVAHTFLASLLVYAFVRRLLRAQPHSIPAALIGAIIFAYGGYLSGYPQLQVAVIEAGVWLPLALFGIHGAFPTVADTVDRRVRWWGIVLAGVALGLSLLAGHPQTTLLFLYASLLFLCWRGYRQRYSWRGLLIGVALFGLIGGGLALVQVLPGLEYLTLTTRGNLSFEAKGNGFPFFDVMQMILPGVLSLWSPLYIGVIGLLLVMAAWFTPSTNAQEQDEHAASPFSVYGERGQGIGVPFWSALTLIALLFSFGRGTILYDLAYNVLPGFSLFRGQERSAYIISLCLAILAAIGTQRLLNGTVSSRFRLAIFGVMMLTGLLFIALVVHRLLTAATDAKLLGIAAFSALIAALSAWLLLHLLKTAAQPRPFSWGAAALVALIIFDLFSVSRGNPNLIDQPASARLAPGFGVREVQTALWREVALPSRVETVRENFGTLYGVMDADGISPLKLATVERVLKLPSRARWHVMATRFVITPDGELPVPSRIINQIDDPYNPFKLHELITPRPFARLVYRAWVEPTPDAAAGLMSDPSFDLAGTVMLGGDPDLDLSASPPPASDAVQVEAFTPEYVRLRVDAPSAALLNVALVNYPGWEATIDDQPAPILTADLAMMAIPLREAGLRVVELHFRQRSYVIGATGSLVALLAVLASAIIVAFSKRTA